MIEKITGSCLCRKVEYEIENRFEKFYLCHCSQCQKISGSVHVSNLFGLKESFRWLSGEQDIKRYEYPDRGFTNAFCRECGCGVPYLNQSGTAMVVRAGSLDGEPLFSNPGKIFHSERAKWGAMAETARIFDKFPSE